MFCLNRWRPGSRNSPKVPQLLWERGISVLLKTRLNSFHRQNKETEAPKEGAHLAWSPQLGLALTRWLTCGVQAPASHTGAFPEFTARSKRKTLFLVFLSSKYRRYVQEILQVKREVGKKLKYLKGLLWNRWVQVKSAWNHPEKHLEAAAAIHHVCIHWVCFRSILDHTSYKLLCHFKQCFTRRVTAADELIHWGRQADSQDHPPQGAHSGTHPTCHVPTNPYHQEDKTDACSSTLSQTGY